MSPVWAILVPLCAGFLLPLLSIFGKKAVPAFTVSIGAVSSLVSLSVAMSGWEGLSVTLGGWGPELGISLVVDRISGTFLTLGAIGFPLSLAVSTERFGLSPWRFYVIFFLSWASVNGILLTGDLFNLFVFFEIFSVAAYLMVSYPPRSWRAVEASLKYLILGTVGALFLLLGIAYSFMATGQLNMAALSLVLPSVPSATLAVIAGCIFTGLFVKSGTVPTHFWLPDAHSSAQTSVSALLSGVLVKVSLYGMIRLSYLLFMDAGIGIMPVMTAFGTLSVILGHLMAFQQEDVKRLLAYSTVAQVGTVLVGIGCGSALGISAAILHSFVHMASKMGLFLVSGVLVEDRGTREIAEMRGLFFHRPLFVLLFCFLAASLAGVPPFSGFFSKWYLLRAISEAGYVVPAVVLVGGTVVSAAYYLRIARAFFSFSDEPPVHRRPHPVTFRAILFLSILCLALAVMPLIPWFRDFLGDIGIYGMSGDLYRNVMAP
ncbi:NADH dehydrogenase (quinone) [Dethiosulfovibrio peptidovorans DSM 11002]|uniref:NADH dehydrogenase (Quinone) n=1 Tax=Dethiosulfovibrio peptidovorans DSM 11002 TaxID=469381 RepID=D2Z4C4_9BACT|nr:proton-conducting transporter membrane subunit [Dethiosulfovibrio peptidovorans]EFC90453.1 NADH dehydrogenase (quinone) [Dethiosulfovibrio peptidovorans DSM 11002]